MPSLDLSLFPPVFVLSTYFPPEDLHELEDGLLEAGAGLTYDVREARVVFSRVLKPRRVVLELRGLGVWCEMLESSKVGLGKRKREGTEDGDESTESEAEDARGQAGGEQVIKIVRPEWFAESQKAGNPLPLEDFLILQCRPVDRPSNATLPPKPPTSAKKNSKSPVRTTAASPANTTTLQQTILNRAKDDADPTARPAARTLKRRFGKPHQPSTSAPASWAASSQPATKPKYAHLLQETTTEHDAATENAANTDIPPPPTWVTQNLKYACQRSTPFHNPNGAFIGQLKKIREARILTLDEIGVRAYSTCIASLAAYPHPLHHPREILGLPGCDAKIANLFVDFVHSGSGVLPAVAELEADEDMQVLQHFYGVWGVGAATAREWLYEKGWKDLDDVVEFGWKSLSRVQQIGVKFYDEFLDLIPRVEVEGIAAVVHGHAVKVRDEGVQSLVVGGYRRGKEASGDVDIILSHPDERQTLGLITDVVASLESEGWVTHTLLLSLQATERGQATLPFRNSGSGSGGHGFDTLDKALVVWQDPVWATRKQDLRHNANAKNPNIHRRVDIIIAPWRTVGCAVLGWSGGTTFQRDLRRYCKVEKGWKFDSSGVRERGSGEVVDLERWGDGAGGQGRAEGMVEAERRVFEGMGLEWREAGERCTG
ncbi:hypothetical protein B0A50_03249 [Salinomyces thailandicus]|uniref:DNA polymerase n=1 Tax=Salinomyces thailandicus TaxID=706561 RepID=A0A4U0U6R2_9PEZI|nr:hypothetical protein B0A50_03249 [Salinomyces thailandica]